MSPSRSFSPLPATTALLALSALLPTGSTAERTNSHGGEGYSYGEEIPVSCLERTMLVDLLQSLLTMCSPKEIAIADYQRVQGRRACMRQPLLTTQNNAIDQAIDHRRPRQTPIHPLRNLQRDLPPPRPTLRRLRNNNLHPALPLRLALPPARILRALRRPNDLPHPNSAPHTIQHRAVQPLKNKPRVRRGRLARSAERARPAVHAAYHRAAGHVAAKPFAYLDGYEHAHA